MLLGCIADDFTGATDLANNLVRNGMRTVQAIGVPRAAIASDADAVVVALKSRTIAAADAVAQSLAACAWLHARGQVLDQSLDRDEVQLSVRLSPDNWARFQAMEPA